MNNSHGLKYKTIGNVFPKGKPRIYFCCHPDDFDKYFEPITKELLFHQPNAAIWFYDPADGIPEGADFLSNLSIMHLFVVPVTGKFLYTESSARMTELPAALEKHIPILPLMQEPGLGRDFNRICGSFQYLDRMAIERDPTMLPYEEKLKKFLESVLISDRLAEQIKDAFDAYIFLSYRKKDRKYAQAIMSLIHENPFCRDIAIWYDEYLVPGENFNEAIADAMTKSRLFTLVVTPSLLENPNYVMTTEYPAAVRAGKPILPVEAVRTNDAALTSLYAGIAPRVSVLDRQSLADSLHKSLGQLVLQEQDSSPKHLFFIGLAYLAGIDMEIDHKRALSLITQAAEDGLPEACEKLTYMYRNGEGTSRDYRTAIKWQEHLIGLLDELQSNDQLSGKDSSQNKLIAALTELGDMYRDLGMLNEAGNAFSRMISEAESFADYAGTIQARKNLGAAWQRLGDLRQTQGDLASAEMLFKKDLALTETLLAQADQPRGNGSKHRSISSTSLRRSLSTSHVKLGDVLLAEGNLKDAIDHYKRSLSLRAELAHETGTEKDRRLLSISYEKLGDLYYKEHDNAPARTYFQKALAISEELLAEQETIDTLTDIAVGYEKMGDVFTEGRSLSESLDYYQKCLDTRQKLHKELQSVISLYALSVSYLKMGQVLQIKHENDKALSYYLKGAETIQDLVRQAPMIEYRKDLAISYITIGDLCFKEKDLIKAGEYFGKSLNIFECLMGEANTLENRRLYCEGCSLVAKACREQGDIASAQKYFQAAVDVHEQIAKEVKTARAYDDLAMACYRLGILGKPALINRACSIFASLARQFPKQTRYAMMRDNLRKGV